MNQHSEELYLEAEVAMKNSDYIAAKRNYEEILLEEPTSACTHNSLGWLYKTQFDDYTKAEGHYKAAIKYEPNYPHTYWNLAYLYTDLERWDELSDLMKLCLSIPSVDKGTAYNRLGVMEELKGNLTVAREYYVKSILLVINHDKLEEFKRDVERCDYKIGLK